MKLRINKGEIFGISKYIILLLLFAACARFETLTFDDNLPNTETKVETRSNASASEKGTILLDHFDEGLGWQWWTTDRIKISTYKSSIVAEGNKVGPDWGCFGKNLGGAIDLSNNQVLKLRVSAEGDAKAPELQITLRDGDKHETNGKPQRIKIPVDGKFREFYINMTDRWIQTWPNKKTVNPSIITDMLIFINPGGRPFSGTVQIDYIEAIPLSQMPEGADVVPFNGIVDLFNDDNMIWWMTDNIDLDIEDNAMKVTCHGVGPKSECLGRRFDPVDFTKFPILKVRVKAPVGKTPLHLKVMIQDSKENLTDVQPMEIDVKSDGQYDDFYYSFAGKFKQLPESKGVDRQKVNPKDIVQVLIYPNQGGTPFEGDFFVDEIRILTYDSIPAGLLGKPYGMIDDFNTDVLNWQATNTDKVKLKITDGELKIDMDNITAESVSGKIDKLDFENYPILRFRAKAKGGSKPILLVGLKDTNNNQSMQDSMFVAINNDGNFSEYSINFKDVIKQQGEEDNKINLSDIAGITFYLRATQESFSGTIILDDIKISAR